ncbi:MAG: lipopolysaccharide transport system ATP-binding protein [Gaiellaceae bacterium]|nr:lipopolysaccharide transport system ATP-binding protein [Gaiellaceae bacterium]
MRPLTVGIVGGFDVMNFGDLLFPLLAEHELRERLGDVTVRAYSHNELAPPDWPYPVRALERLGHDLDAQDLDLVLVGGGHLVRFDKDVALDYGSTSPAVHHPTGYWLTPTLVAGAAGIPVAWNALGVSPDTPAWAGPLVAAALEVASYVSVRDEPSARELRGLTRTANVEVVPDTAFGVTRLLAADASDRLSQIVSPPYVVVQATPNLRPHAEKIATAAEPLRDAGIALLEVAISPALGDRGGKLGIGQPLVIEPWAQPLLLAELIGRAEAVVAFSLHLSIAAVAQGVPVYRPASLPGEKYELLEQFPNVHTWNGTADTLLLDERGRRSPGAEAEDMAARLVQHWDEIASLVGTAPRRHFARLSALLAELTAQLES